MLRLVYFNVQVVLCTMPLHGGNLAGLLCVQSHFMASDSDSFASVSRLCENIRKKAALRAGTRQRHRFMQYKVLSVMAQYIIKVFQP